MRTETGQAGQEVQRMPQLLLLGPFPSFAIGRGVITAID